MQLLVHFFERPAQTRGVLAHLKTGRSHAASVCGLRGTECHACLLELLDGLGGGRHVRALGDELAAVLYEQLRALAVQLVLGGAGKRDVAGDGPYAVAAFDVLRALDSVGVLLDPLSLHFLDLLDDVEVDALLVHDVAVGVGKRDDLCAQLLSLLGRVDGDVARAGDDDGLALELGARALEHFLREVAEAVAGRLGTDEGTAVGEALAGQDARELVTQTLVLSEHEADLAAAHADVARGYVGIRADVLGKLGHEGLAETHDLVIALALGVEVRTALAAAHGERGEAVLEDLLEAQELNDGRRHGRVESETALVRSDGGVELHSEAAVDLHLAVVVHPADSELDESLGLDDALEDACVDKVGALCGDGFKGLEDLSHGLKELRFVGISLGDRIVYGSDVRVFEHVYFLRINYT